MSTCRACEYCTVDRLGHAGTCLALAERILREWGVRTAGEVPVRLDEEHECVDFALSSESEELERMQADDEPASYPHDPFAATAGRLTKDTTVTESRR